MSTLPQFKPCKLQFSSSSLRIKYKGCSCTTCVSVYQKNTYKQLIDTRRETSSRLMLKIKWTDNSSKRWAMYGMRIPYFSHLKTCPRVLNHEFFTKKKIKINIPKLFYHITSVLSCSISNIFFLGNYKDAMKLQFELHQVPFPLRDKIQTPSRHSNFSTCLCSHQCFLIKLIEELCQSFKD